MSFRLWTIFYVFALVAAAMATFGPIGAFVALCMLGFWAYCRKSGYPATNRQCMVCAIISLVVLLALLIPVGQSTRQAPRRNLCMQNLKEIQLAILNYEGAKTTLPPAFLADANGKPMHSWRVLILPFLGATALYARYNFNEPWDGPNNSNLAAQIPEAYRCPSHDHGRTDRPGETQYFAVVGPETAWPNSRGRRIAELSDGTARSIMVIEASGMGVNWLQPQDVNLDQAVELLTTKSQSGHIGSDVRFFTTTYYDASYRNVVYVDGHWQWMGQLKDRDLAKALLTVAGGEPWPTAPFDWESKFKEAKTSTVINWGNVWALTIFILLALLPAYLIYREVAARQSVNAASNSANELEVTIAAAAPEII